MSGRTLLSLMLGMAFLVIVYASRDFQHGVIKSVKPPHTEYARVCRWLVHENSWGVLAGVTADAEPISGVLSFSDGPVDHSTGRIIMVLTPMDALARSVMANPKASFTLSEEQLRPHGCGETDPQDPTCARVNVIGGVHAVPAEKLPEARDLLLSRHPDVASWPDDHGFQLYELHVERLELLDWYGGMHVISAEEYFSADVRGLGKDKRSTSIRALR